MSLPFETNGLQTLLTPRKKCWLRRAACLLLALIILLLIALEILSRGAALIFNHAMENQDMLRGTITVDRMISDITGHVYFDNLAWYDPDGEPILTIPSGDFRVNVWDVLTRDFKSTTIEELTVNNAAISIHLNDKMQMDFVRPSPDLDKVKDADDDDWRNKVSLDSLNEEQRRAVGEWRRQRRQHKLQKNWRNFNRAGRRIRLKLNAHDCRMEVFYRDRHYLMSHVQIAMNGDTNRDMELALSIGGFGGTMIGDAIALNGKVDFTQQPEPTCDTSLVLYQVDPSSLGFGMNIHDKMTLSTYFTGPVSHPIGTGTVHMDELHIPALDFTDVDGSVYYENSLLSFRDVTASVYDGDLAAYGDYDLDTRVYHLYGHGTDLDTGIALPKSRLHCRVDMDLAIESKGSARETVSSGSFVSGAGQYRRIPFESISGRFTDAYRDLHFYDVAITFSGFRVTTDALRIKDNKLMLNPIHLTDLAGRPIYTYDPASER
ncbi:MAG: hypothetical protein PUG02_07855 [Selenomonadaceae bacterium]|nr:hypothetical protein [Selenomonadaceae bacterium]